MAGAKPRGRLRRRWLLLSLLGAGFLLALAAAGVAVASKPWTPLSKPTKIEITALPVDFDRNDPDRKAFGKLVFRRGLTLYANSNHFGGYSALAIDPSGDQLIAISDAGTWLRADLDYDGRFLKGLSNAAIGPLLAKDGKPLASFSRRDAEAIALKSPGTKSGEAYIAFEVDHRIDRYPFDANGFGPPDGSVPLPDNTLNGNAGIEALAFLKAGPANGGLLAFSQERHNSSGALVGWIIGGLSPGTLALEDIGDFTITDMTVLPGGDLVMLERRLSLSHGMEMRIRRVPASEIKPGAVLHGEVLLEVQNAFNIDNMEAIGAHEESDGQTVLTIMSDDNFLKLQRTLILQFTLKGPERQDSAG
ncbi:esterase-like activity of phytase family protein [Methyloligella solikamskensis]|uniref:Esterase-like activity of phytase family protein n=1 Tax=Methyloligella solikamskensis TaxID=1177756 RepID=A0ABW3J6W4_9HYPH